MPAIPFQSGRSATVPTARRDLRLDFLRGLCLVVMIVDHLGGASWWYTVTGGDEFFVSAGEGFVFISGVVFGLVYRGVLRREGVAALWRKALRRALTLYLAILALTAVLVVLSLATAGRWTESFGGWADLEAFAIQVVTLRSTFDFVDVLLLYTFLVAIGPALVLALDRGGTWLVLAGSAGLWLAYQLAPETVQIPWPIAGLGLFQFAPWQILFVAGLVIGYHRERFAAATAAFRTWPAWLLFVALTAGLIGLAANQGQIVEALWPGLAGAERLAAWTDKVSLPPARLVAAGIVFAAFFLTVARFWRPIRAALGWLLIPLGQHALYAYSVHVAIVVLLTAWLPWLPGYDRWLEAPNSLAQIGGVLLVWWLIRRRFLFGIIPH